MGSARSPGLPDTLAARTGGADRPRTTTGRRPVVGVMGSGTVAHEDRAVPLGRCLAALGVNLLTGGGGGVMASVSRAFHDTPDRVGLVIGVLPGDSSGQAREPYPNPWVEIAIRTHLPLSGESGTEPMSRNHINVLSADVVIALPGGTGTGSEVRLAWRYGRPTAAFIDTPEAIPGLPDAIPVMPDIDALQAFVRASLGLDG